MKYELIGVSEVQSILKELPQALNFSILRSFHRKALSQEIVKPLKSVLPYSSETVKNIKIGTNRDPNKTAVYAGPTTDAYYLRFVEYGTVERKGGRGRISPRPKIESFTYSKIQSLINYINKEYANEISKTVDKKRKRLAKK